MCYGVISDANNFNACASLTDDHLGGDISTTMDCDWVLCSGQVEKLFQVSRYLMGILVVSNDGFITSHIKVSVFGIDNLSSRVIPHIDIFQFNSFFFTVYNYVFYANLIVNFALLSYVL